MNIKDELIKVQRMYIELLGYELGKSAAFLHIHGMDATEEVVSKGMALRQEIERLTEEWNKLPAKSSPEEVLRDISTKTGNEFLFNNIVVRRFTIKAMEHFANLTNKPTRTKK